VATIAGFAVFALSPSPLVRSFGLLLMVGIGLAFLVALTGGLAALGLSAWRGGAHDQPPQPAGPRRTAIGERLRRTGESAVALSIVRPRRVLLAGLLLAVCGWIAS